MATKPLLLSAFNAKRLKEGWTRIAELSDFQAFTNFVNYSGNPNHERFGSYVMKQVMEVYPEVQKQAGPEAPNRGPITFFLHESVIHTSLRCMHNTLVIIIVWT